MELYKEATSISGGGQTKLIVHRAIEVRSGALWNVSSWFGARGGGVKTAGTTGGIGNYLEPRPGAH